VTASTKKQKPLHDVFRNFQKSKPYDCKLTVLPWLMRRMQLFRRRREEKAPLIVQNSRIRYRDEDKLRDLLNGLFPDGNFRMRVSEPI
jgi:hypothetical protein